MIDEDEESLLILQIPRYGIDNDIMQLCGKFDEADKLCGIALLLLNNIVSEGGSRWMELIQATLSTSHLCHSMNHIACIFQLYGQAMKWKNGNCKSKNG